MEQPSPVVSPKRRAKFLIAGGVIVVTLVSLIAWAMARPGSTAFYLTTSELSAAGTTAPTSDFRVNGTLVPGSVRREGLVTTFDITDGKTPLTVTTDRPLPDAFYSKEEVEIVAQGDYDGRMFTASDVFAKCPSKFKAKA